VIGDTAILSDVRFFNDKNAKGRNCLKNGIKKRIAVGLRAGDYFAACGHTKLHGFFRKSSGRAGKNDVPMFNRKSAV
jgi:hypothetical protein